MSRLFFAKLYSVVISLVGLGLAVYTWAYMNLYTDLDLVTPKMWGQSALDVLVIATCVAAGLAALACPVSEKGPWRDVFYGLPLFVSNAITAYTWWQMEQGFGTDPIVAVSLLGFVMMLNLIASVAAVIRGLKGRKVLTIRP